MPDRHLTQIRFGAGIRDTVLKGYGRADLLADLWAGLTVGIIAIPLAMALAIASGVPPQYGLYTAIVAGLIAALLGGSRYSVTGPTAAFVVLLVPVAQNYGLGGLLTATFLAGLMLVMLGLTRLGRLLQFVPNAVILGFTAGIAVVIASLQLNDFLGLGVETLPEGFTGRLGALIEQVDAVHLPTLLVGLVTLVILVLWPRLGVRIPGHLIAVLAGTLLALALEYWLPGAAGIETIGSRFSYLIDGVEGRGIPPVLPAFQWPWDYPGPDALPLGFSWSTVQSLLGPAMAIAALGAIESLLCATVLDGMTRTRHNANGELVGQGLANIVAPFFGGFVATAAIARSAANVRAGGRTPVAAAIHSVTVLAGILLLARYLAFVPMAVMAALLLVVAWNISEARHVVRVIRRAPREDVLVLLVCLTLTVFVDMVMAIAVGIVLASLLFMRTMAQHARVAVMDDTSPRMSGTPPPGVRVYRFDGPLFFAAAEKTVGTLRQVPDSFHRVIFYMDGVPVIDASGAVALVGLIEDLLARKIAVTIADLPSAPRQILMRSGLDGLMAQVTLTDSLKGALEHAREAGTGLPAG
ncbi:C4-dicarboxylic acid transporter DauA [Hydrocarboniclastica marina]|uniref:C4-dicarboxylic acid transporter DauA n=1 Tax=Hydrocarboniclastica marina TaxID=2259620 RepID=A0A4P7XEU2_9ALTE|nr:C4-dicarboxylic acid transporter DauA [Hydrocarboniclastica marina]QCF25396.1 C4-dicarboxylic acid transporter DauA [Hydrocarboniclastica marina]